MQKAKRLETDRKTTFVYKYSAPQNKELQEIRRKYLTERESKLEEIKRLDREVQLAGATESLSIGILGCLIFCLGLCFVMHIIGNGLLIGIFTDIIGIAAMIAAFPVHRHVSKKVKARLVPRILMLTAELTGEKSPSN